MRKSTHKIGTVTLQVMLQAMRVTREGRRAVVFILTNNSVVSFSFLQFWCFLSEKELVRTWVRY